MCVMSGCGFVSWFVLCLIVCMSYLDVYGVSVYVSCMSCLGVGVHGCGLCIVAVCAVCGCILCGGGGVMSFHNTLDVVCSPGGLGHGAGPISAACAL